MRALAKRPEDRPPGVAAFYEQLAELQVVDDGSAKFQTDAPTVPTVETLARGGPALVSTSGPDVDVEKLTLVAPRGGWLEAARSRLTDGIVSFEARSETAPHEPPPHALEPGVELPAPSQRGARGDTPMTGASAPRVEGRRRLPTAAIVGISAALVGAAAWSGWKPRPASPARTPVEPPSLVTAATAPTVDPGAAPKASPPLSSADPATVDASALTALRTAWATEGLPRVGPPSAPPRRGPLSPPPSPSNLDDVLFGRTDPPRSTAPASGAHSAAPAAWRSAFRSPSRTARRTATA